MRKILYGRVYDTETATLICAVDPPGSNARGDMNYSDVGLYRSPKGKYFLAGETGARGRFARTVDQNSSTAGSGMELLSDEDATDLAQRFMDTDDFEEAFGEVEAG